MPIYEYKCDLCNGLWEEIQKFSDDPTTVCKSCEKEGGVHKLISGGIAFHLKGGGWAQDAYGKQKIPINKEGTHLNDPKVEQDRQLYHWDSDEGEVVNTLSDAANSKGNIDPHTPHVTDMRIEKRLPGEKPDKPLSGGEGGEVRGETLFGGDQVTGGQDKSLTGRKK